ncbi:MAG: 3-hydroxyacyl-ACP dehydratase FabZ [Myxococcaceae bacterium]
MLNVLPHKYPFLFVDRVVEVELGKRIKAYKNLTHNESFFNGHFPNNPIMPGVLQIEALAQAGAILCHESKLYDSKTQLAVLAGVDEVRFRKAVRPGDRLDLEVELLAFKKTICKLKAKAYVDGELACEAIIIAAVLDRV